ncbi:MAG: fasciclin domain-containing protein [Candidatus Solibacter sp.]
MKKLMLSAVLALSCLSAARAADIVDTAIAAGQFTTLVKAIQAAGLVDTLKSAGPFTVFAPTDAAFAKLPAGALDSLIANPEKLKAVLSYHVVAGKVMAKDVKPGAVTTVAGASVMLSAKGGKVMIDKATVVKADIECSNGVIHVIDSVIMPKM